MFFGPPGAVMTLTVSKFFIILKKVAGKLILRYEGCITKDMAAIPLLVKITKNKRFFVHHMCPRVMTFTKI